MVMEAVGAAAKQGSATAQAVQSAGRVRRDVVRHACGVPVRHEGIRDVPLRAPPRWVGGSGGERWLLTVLLV